jgi:hypothetical protein
MNAAGVLQTGGVMTIEYTLSQMEAVLGNSAKRPGLQASWGWCTRLVLGGLVAAFLIGLVQDAVRVASIQAESESARVIVISKEEAWLRIHRRLRPPHVRPAAQNQSTARS